MSLAMRKPVFGICENKDADQLRGNREADQAMIKNISVSPDPTLTENFG